MMSENETIFQSSIKVKGINLLPPMITDKRRLELQSFKKQAMKLEKRLQNCRELQRNLDELLNIQPLSERPQSAITFGDNSHIEALGITTSRNICSARKKMHLSKDIIDVTEYSNDGIKIIGGENETNCTEVNQGQIPNTINHMIKLNDHSESSEIRLASQPTSNIENIRGREVQGCLNLDLRDLSAETSNNPLTEVQENISPTKTPKTRLIRSNSYTLEAPSPILLAHLEKYNKQEENEINPTDEIFSRHWSSTENNYVPFENSEFSSLNTVYNMDPNKNENDKRVDEASSPRIEVIQTDISVQQITVNGNNGENELPESSFDLSNPDSQLMQVLQKIPKNYSKQIIDLIEKQRADPSTKTLETFKKVQNQYLDKLPRRDTNVQDDVNKFSRNESNENHQTEIIYDSKDRTKSGERSYSSAVSVSPSQSLDYSVSSSGTLVANSPSSMKLTDLEFKGDSPNNEMFDSGKNLKNIIERCYSISPTCKVNFSRELCPRLDEDKLYNIKQCWAASVIGAHVKGYLTRRLLKTEKVQSLIETIKDALLCALQLHSSDNIDESDVELHRRLINQVSAACYAFHDIFFSLSVPEQMSVIALDRQRRIERAKRPLSTTSSQRSRSNSRHSSTKSSTPQSRSSTNV
nr:uncharacterized protein LOC111507363 [Leptinotarsa decemlineata]XP_023018427.1 uncharacterized protein LOC111507363 [Leptinotarsa decemlineata]